MSPAAKPFRGFRVEWWKTPDVGIRLIEVEGSETLENHKSARADGKEKSFLNGGAPATREDILQGKNRSIPRVIYLELTFRGRDCPGQEDWMKIWIMLTLLAWVFFPPAGACSEWQSVEKILGQSGVVEGDVLRISIPRVDLNVLVSGVSMDPGLATTSWFAFKPIRGIQTLEKPTDQAGEKAGKEGNNAEKAPRKPAKGTLLLGNLVLLDQEVPNVILTLIRHGFQVTGLSHPLLHESPALECLSFTAQGARSRLAETLREALYHTGTPVSPGAKPLPTRPSLSLGEKSFPHPPRPRASPRNAFGPP